MSRSGHGTHASAKSAALLALVSLLAVALMQDLLWASSSSSTSSAFLSIASRSSVEKDNRIIVKPNPKNHTIPTKEARSRLISPSQQMISPTFGDLPAPELDWEQMPSAPVPRLDGFAVQIKNLFFVFSGYGTIDYVHSHADIFNFSDNTWCGRIETPKEMANSHLGMACDGRYIYVVAGQPGPQCSVPPTSRTFVLDTETRNWDTFPPLPASRYAPATQLWRGRLHVMGGSKEDRGTPAVDHWSIKVKNGKAVEKEWRNELPVPRGGPHRACVAVNDKLYVIGGQEGDFMPKPGSPIFKCSRRPQVIYGDVYMLDKEMKWKALSSMPKPDSHIESSWVILDNSIIVVGGTTENHPVTKKMMLVGEIFRFHLDTLQWSVIGKLPFRVKTTMAGVWDGWLYFTSGQRDRGPVYVGQKSVNRALCHAKFLRLWDWKFDRHLFYRMRFTCFFLGRLHGYPGYVPHKK